MGHPVVIYMGLVSGMFALTALATSAVSALWIFALIHIGTAVGLLALESWEQIARLPKLAARWRGRLPAGAPSPAAHAYAWVRARGQRLRAQLSPHLPDVAKTAPRHRQCQATAEYRGASQKSRPVTVPIREGKEHRECHEPTPP